MNFRMEISVEPKMLLIYLFSIIIFLAVVFSVLTFGTLKSKVLNLMFDTIFSLGRDLITNTLNSLPPTAAFYVCSINDVHIPPSKHSGIPR